MLQLNLVGTLLNQQNQGDQQVQNGLLGQQQQQDSQIQGQLNNQLNQDQQNQQALLNQGKSGQSSSTQGSSGQSTNTAQPGTVGRHLLARKRNLMSFLPDLNNDINNKVCAARHFCAYAASFLAKAAVIGYV